MFMMNLIYHDEEGEIAHSIIMVYHFLSLASAVQMECGVGKSAKSVESV
jgi:hypothetical protein